MSYCADSGLYEGFIYCIENNINRKRYIGQTQKTISERFCEHKWDSLHRGEDTMMLHRAMRKYGCDNFSVFEICKITSKTKYEMRKLLDDAEIFYITSFSTKSPNGYNVTSGGYIKSEDSKKPVFCFTMSGKLICQYESMSEAERITGISHSHLSQVVSENYIGRKSAGGYLWSLSETPPIYDADPAKGKRKGVVQMTKDGEIIKRFRSVLMAANELNLQPSLISACCHGKRKTTGGYRWSFI